MKYRLLLGWLAALSAPAWAQKSAVLDFSQCPRPQWPVSALRNETEGTTTIALSVAVGGNVTKASIAASSGSAELDAAALASIQACQFKPLKRSVNTKMQYRWTLEDAGRTASVAQAAGHGMQETAAWLSANLKPLDRYLCLGPYPWWSDKRSYTLSVTGLLQISSSLSSGDIRSTTPRVIKTEISALLDELDRQPAVGFFPATRAYAPSCAPQLAPPIAIFVIKLQCHAKKCINVGGSMESEYIFEISNVGDRERIEQAFRHMLELGGARNPGGS